MARTPLLFAACICLSPALLADEPLSVGVAVVEITPPIGYPLAGYYHERASTGVHDPLRAKAIVLRQGDARAAFVVCDLVALPRSATDAARALGERVTGIPSANIAVIATHTHTGPDFFGPHRERLRARTPEDKRAPRAIDYEAFLVQRIADALDHAQGASRPMTLRVGASSETALSFIRRFRMDDGSLRTNPGKRNPGILAPVGTIDPEISLLSFHSAGADTPAALLHVFALHLDTVGGTEMSADFPYALERRLREGLGPGFVSVFANGTCGDINHVDVSTTAPQRGHDEAQRIGEALADDIARVLPTLKPIAQPALAVRGERVIVPFQRYAPERIAWAEGTLDEPRVPFLTLVEAAKIYKLQAMGMPAESPLEVQAFRIAGDVAIVTLPGEVFVDLGKAIKARSPFRHTFVIELANDSPAYVPTLAGFAQGGYEAINSNIAPGGGEMLVDAAVGLLQQLTR